MEGALGERILLWGSEGWWMGNRRITGFIIISLVINKNGLGQP
jgi:hypothetical protein